MTLKPSRYGTYLGVLLLLAVAARMWHLDWSLPAVYEEATPLAKSWSFWPGEEGTWSLHPHFFNYPALTFYLHGIVQAVHFVIGLAAGWWSDSWAFRTAFGADPTTFVLLSRGLTAAFDIATIFIASLLARRIAGGEAALLSAAVLAVCPLHVLCAQHIAVDVPLATFVTLTVLFATLFVETRRASWLLLAGVATGLAASTKYTGALVAAVVVLGWIVVAAGDERPAPRPRVTDLAGALALSLGVFMILNPFVILDYPAFAADFRFEREHMAQGHFGVEENTPAVVFYFLKVLPNALGWPLAVAAVASPFILWKRTGRTWLAIAVGAGLLLLIVSFWTMRAERYILPAVPLLAVLGCSATAAELRVLAGRFRSRRVLRMGGAAIILSLVFLAEPVNELLAYHRSLGEPDTRTLAKKWIEENIPDGSVVAMAPQGFFLDSTLVTFPIPYAAVGFDSLAGFYDARWYVNCDYVLGGDFDRARYLLEPERYWKFLRYFYDSLFTRWTLVHEVTAAPERQGPGIWLYAPPSVRDTVFAGDVLERLREVKNRRLMRGFVGNLAAVLDSRGLQAKADQLRREFLSIMAERAPADERRAAVDYLLGRSPSNMFLLSYRDSLMVGADVRPR